MSKRDELLTQLGEILQEDVYKERGRPFENEPTRLVALAPPEPTLFGSLNWWKVTPALLGVILLVCLWADYAPSRLRRNGWGAPLGLIFVCGSLTGVVVHPFFRKPKK